MVAAFPTSIIIVISVTKITTGAAEAQYFNTTNRFAGKQVEEVE